MLEAVCPNGHRLQIPPEHAGMKLRCPACNAIFQLAGIPPGAGASGTGLPSVGGAAGAAPSPGATTPAPHAGAPSVSPTTPAGAETPGSRWAGTEAPAVAPSPPQPAPTPRPQPAPAPIAPPPGMPRHVDLHASARTWGQATLMVGLVLVLAARGCDGLALRNVASLKAKLDLAQNALKDEEYAESKVYLAQVDDADLAQAKRDDAKKKLDDVRKNFEKRRAELTAGDWHDLETAARDAQAENQRSGYWREMLFVAGTILFAIGLLAVMSFGQAAERYLAFGMLAIIVFSVYIGGTAWISSIAGTMSGIGSGLR